RSRIETIRVGHVFEPVNAITPAPGDEPEPAHRFLVAAEEMTEDVLDRPPILGPGAKDLALGQPGYERQRGLAGRHDPPDRVAPPLRERGRSSRPHDKRNGSRHATTG